MNHHHHEPSLSWTIIIIIIIIITTTIIIIIFIFIIIMIFQFVRFVLFVLLSVFDFFFGEDKRVSNKTWKDRNSEYWNIPALRAEGLHRGKLNTRARSALVIKTEAQEQADESFFSLMYTISSRWWSDFSEKSRKRMNQSCETHFDCQQQRFPFTPHHQSSSSSIIPGSCFITRPRLRGVSSSMTSGPVISARGLNMSTQEIG